MDPNQWRQLLQGFNMQTPIPPQQGFIPSSPPAYQMPQVGMESLAPGVNKFSGQMPLPGGLDVSGSVLQTPQQKAAEVQLMLRKRMGF